MVNPVVQNREVSSPSAAGIIEQLIITLFADWIAGLRIVTNLTSTCPMTYNIAAVRTIAMLADLAFEFVGVLVPMRWTPANLANDFLLLIVCKSRLCAFHLFCRSVLGTKNYRY